MYVCVSADRSPADGVQQPVHDTGGRPMEPQQEQGGTTVPGRDSRPGGQRCQDPGAGGGQRRQNHDQRGRPASAGRKSPGSRRAVAEDATGKPVAD